MFRSFFLAGFECATGINREGRWIDQVAGTGHDERADEDYALLHQAGIHGARDGVRWPLVDKGGGSYDFSTLLSQLEAANKYECDVIWDLFHYGFPVGVHPLDRSFPDRFANYCRAVARFLKPRYWGPLYFTPCNEPSYFSWAAGDAGLFWPHFKGQAFELKKALAKAAILGTEALWEEAPGCRIVSVDPICRVAAPLDRPELEAEARRFNTEVVFESWDMISGRLFPEFGGTRRHLDIIGVNYYCTNQWEINDSNARLSDTDSRRVSFEELLWAVHARYRGDLMVTETAHCGAYRAEWIRNISRQCLTVRSDGMPLHGACLYPILGMPEWHEPEVWNEMGVWDVDPRTFQRIPHEPALDAIREIHSEFQERQFERSLETPPLRGSERPFEHPRL